jgi:hypothetical protein
LPAQDLKKLHSIEELLAPCNMCMICDRNISKSIKIKDMSSKADPPIIFCLECLLKGQEKEDVDHRRDCEYFVYDSLQYPLVS